jgi:hypothetical protein
MATQEEFESKLAEWQLLCKTLSIYQYDIANYDEYRKKQKLKPRTLKQLRDRFKELQARELKLRTELSEMRP